MLTKPGFRLLLPVKPLNRAKTRLQVSTSLRDQLVLAFLADVVGAAQRSACVSEVVVVTDDVRAQRVARSSGARCWAQGKRPGLNAAVLHALTHHRAGPVAVVLPDLPALREEHLQTVLEQVLATDEPAMIADRQGSGTTMLLAPNARCLRPGFGRGSAARHASAGHRPLNGVDAGLRQDVDTWTDLETARVLGVGPSTRAVLAQLAGERAEAFRPRVTSR